MKKLSCESANYMRADDLGGLELLRAQYHTQCFSRHVHEGYTIGVIEQGAQRFFREGSNHFAPRDSIILVNADQVHDGHSATDGGWSYQAMYPVPELFTAVTDELKGPAMGLPYFPEPVVYDPLMADEVRQLFRLLHGSQNQLARETYLMELLATLIQRHSKSPTELNPLNHEPQAISRTREYLDAHFADSISIHTLAKMVNLNPYYLTRLFKQCVGLPPHAYQVQRRLQAAKRLIQSHISLADVAAQCGFTDQSHLSRHFKKAIGVTPGLYKG